MFNPLTPSHHHRNNPPSSQPSQPHPDMSPSGQTNSTLASFTTQPEDHRRRKRNRTMQSCLPCHTNKRKCNRGRPCERCISLGITGNCVYETEDPSVIKKIDLKDPACEIARLRGRIAELEGVVRILKGRPHPKQQRHANAASPHLTSPTPGPSSPIFAQSHPQSIGPCSVHGDSSSHTPILEMFRSSRNGSVDSFESMSPSFPHSNYHCARPTRSSSFKSDLDSLVEDFKDNQRSENLPYLRQSSCPPGMKSYGEDQNVIEDDEDGRKLFLGHAAGGSLLRKLQGLTSPELKPYPLDSSIPPRDELITAKVAYMGLFGGKIGKRWAFETPGSVTSNSDMRNILMDALPSVACAQQLLESFLDDVDCFYHAWHTPTIVDLYQGFFSSSRSEQELLPFNQMSVILAMLTATSDLTDRIIDAPPIIVGESRDDYRKRLKAWRFSFSNKLASCTVHALKLASYLGHPSIECIQAQLLLILYMVNNDRCTDAWCFIGGIIKQAQCLGLHIDPSKLNPHMPVLEQELRRRVWWSIQTWDVFLGIAFGWPAGVTLSDSDLPTDRTEQSLLGQAQPNPPSLPPQGVTELTYHVFNWETCLYARDMMDRIFGQAVWSWGKSPEPQEGPKYEQVVKLDTTIKTWYHRVPAAMRFEPDPIEDHPAKSNGYFPTTSSVFQPSSSGVGIEDIRRREPMLAKQALLLSISQNTILLLLHRPFISLSLENSSGGNGHQMSEEQCVRSSQVIIEAQRLLVELFPATRGMWYGWYLTFHAAMTCAWISLLRSPTHPMSGLSRKCITLGIETFEFVIRTPESLPENYLRACSQLCAIRDYSNRKLNPPKAIACSTHVFGPTSSLPPFAYNLTARTMTSVGRSMERYPNFSESSTRLNFNNERESIVFDDQKTPSRTSLSSNPSSFPHTQPTSSHCSVSNFDKNSSLDPKTSDSPLESPSHPLPNQFEPDQPSIHLSRFPSSSETLNRESTNSIPIRSESSHHRSPSSTEPRSSLNQPGMMHPLDYYSSIGSLAQPQLPPIHGFLTPASGSGMGFCTGNPSGSTPPLYTAQYAMNSLQYHDVNVNMNVPLSMLVMDHVNSNDEHGHESHQSCHRYQYDSMHHIRDDNQTNNLLFGGYLKEN